MRGTPSFGVRIRVRLSRNSGTLTPVGLLDCWGTLEEHGLLIPCGTLRDLGLLGIIGLLVANITRRKLKGKLFLIFLSSVGA